MQNGIIFDCDGTLVDSLSSAMESFNYALDRLGEAPRTPKEIKRFFGAAADRIFFNLLGDERKALQAFEHYKDHQTELSHTMKLHTGIRELLDTLAKHEVPMAIVTGRHAEDLAIVLKPHSISHYFTTLIADSHLPRSKPAPDGILLAARRLGLPPQKTVYVGDSPMDMQAAHAAGATAIAALWDVLAKRELMLSENPQYFASTADEVWAHFRHFARF